MACLLAVYGRLADEHAEVVGDLAEQPDLLIPISHIANVICSL